MIGDFSLVISMGGTTEPVPNQHPKLTLCFEIMGSNLTWFLFFFLFLKALEKISIRPFAYFILIKVLFWTVLDRIDCFFSMDKEGDNTGTNDWYLLRLQRVISPRGGKVPGYFFSVVRYRTKACSSM